MGSKSIKRLPVRKTFVRTSDRDPHWRNQHYTPDRLKPVDRKQSGSKTFSYDTTTSKRLNDINSSLEGGIDKYFDSSLSKDLDPDFASNEWRKKSYTAVLSQDVSAAKDKLNDYLLGKAANPPLSIVDFRNRTDFAADSLMSIKQMRKLPSYNRAKGYETIIGKSGKPVKDPLKGGFKTGDRLPKSDLLAGQEVVMASLLRLGYKDANGFNPSANYIKTSMKRWTESGRAGEADLDMIRFGADSVLSRIQDKAKQKGWNGKDKINLTFVHDGRDPNKVGTNVIPVSYAHALKKFGSDGHKFRVNGEIALNRSEGKSFTGSRVEYRMFNPPSVKGHVEEGSFHALIDDVMTSGSSLNVYRRHIEASGGKVVSINTLSNSTSGRHFLPTKGDRRKDVEAVISKNEDEIEFRKDYDLELNAEIKSASDSKQRQYLKRELDENTKALNSLSNSMKRTKSRLKTKTKEETAEHYLSGIFDKSAGVTNTKKLNRVLQHVIGKGLTQMSMKELRTVDGWLGFISRRKDFKVDPVSPLITTLLDDKFDKNKIEKDIPPRNSNQDNLYVKSSIKDTISRYDSNVSRLYEASNKAMKRYSLSV